MKKRTRLSFVKRDDEDTDSTDEPIDDEMLQQAQLRDLLQRVTVSPSTYPTTCNSDVIAAMAFMLRTGASVAAAAAACGIPPSRVYSWLRKGREACERNDEQDEQESYLACYLALSQAQAQAQVFASARVYNDAPDFWLTHHPDARREWGNAPALSEQEAVDAGTPSVDESASVVSVPPLSNEELAQVLSHLSEINALNAPRALEIVESHDAPIDLTESEVG